MRLALLGKDIQHSKSAQVYRELLGRDIEYQLFDYPSSELIPTLSNLFRTINGLSITSPFKGHFIDQCELSDVAKELGCVNCITKSGSRYLATLTDYNATIQIFDLFDQKEYIILGDGKMSQMMQLILNQKNKNYQVLSRKNKLIYEFDYESIADTLVINCCGRDFEFNSQLSKSNHFWDFNYSHVKHQSHFKKSLCPYTDGYSLLIEQARAALSFWNINS